MDLPALVADRLDGEAVVARVDIDGDAVVTTPTRTLRYYANGLLRDESVEEFPHDVDRIDVVEGRRKSTIRLTDPEDEWEFTVPRSGTDDVLECVLTGVLRTADVVESDETVRDVYRFSELTLLVTGVRLLKHVGDAVWASDYETYPFADVTGLSFEEGAHNTQLILEVDGRPHRIKLPTDASGAVRRSVERALFEFYDVDDLDALNAAVAADRDADAAADEPDDATARSPGTADSTDEIEGSVEESFSIEGGDLAADAPAGLDDPTDVDERLAALESQVERQADLLERQQDLLEQLVDELRRGR
ncbi:MAG: hypothetical protein ABEJ23_03980 [Haloarculaceae archaeon]